MKRSIISALALALVVSSNINAQQDIPSMLGKLKPAIRFSETERFYKLFNNQLAWKESQAKEFLQLLNEAPDLGLEKEDYSYNDLLRKQQKLVKELWDSLETDIKLTDAAIHFFTDLKNGNRHPSLGYEGLKYKLPTGEIVPLLARYLQEDSLSGLVTKLQPNTAEFNNMLQQLRTLNRISSSKNFQEVKISSNKVNGSNASLLRKLYQLGFLDSIPATISTKELVTKVIAAQKMFDLLADGQLRPTTIAAFNIPINRRIKEIKLAMNWLRWMQGLRQNNILVLNIPSAQIYIYNQDSLVLESKAVVGKKNTPTPQLSSTITEVILYPYWHVPKKIAVKELLPRIRSNIGYLEENNYQVLNLKGQLVNPYQVSWNKLDAGYFPYTIRQSTGCDNSLGIVKFNFYNPFSVYLHDTPNKILFGYNKRYYSHGCMRVEMFQEMAHMLLGRNHIAIDSLIEKGCLDQQSPIVLEVENPLPVMVIYSTVWYTANGSMKFYEDIYDKLPALLR